MQYLYTHRLLQPIQLLKVHLVSRPISCFLVDQLTSLVLMQVLETLENQVLLENHVRSPHKSHLSSDLVVILLADLGRPSVGQKFSKHMKGWS